MEPLTPKDCDLRDFAFMPLEVSRLRRSKQWLISKRRPEIGFYALNLWAASWHEVPAASLEDDDDVLADLAMCDPARWPEMRADALRGWVKCSDGRLYHPTVAEKAREAFAAKLAQRQRTEAARNARAVARGAPKMSVTDTVSAVSSSVTEPINATTETVDTEKVPRQTSKGQGQGQREKKVSSSASAPARDPVGVASPPPGPPGQAGELIFDTAARELSLDLAKFRQNALWVNFPAMVLEWKRQGAIDADIWSTIRQIMAKKGGLANSPAYYAKAVLEAKTKRLADTTAAEETQKRDESLPPEHPIWRSRLRTYRETGEWFWGPKPGEAGFLGPKQEAA